MGSDNHVGKLKERVISVAGFFIKCIEPKAAEPTRSQCFAQSLAFNLVRLLDVDQKGARFND